MTPEHIGRDMEVLRSQLKTFSTLASHLRQAVARNEDQIAAVEQEVDMIRQRLFGVLIPEPRISRDIWLDVFMARFGNEAAQ